MRNSNTNKNNVVGFFLLNSRKLPMAEGSETGDHASMSFAYKAHEPHHHAFGIDFNPNIAFSPGARIAPSPCATHLPINFANMASVLKVVVVEDSMAVRERLVASLAKMDNVELIGEYDDAKGAIDGIRDGMPDVVLLDIKLRGSSGMEVMQQLIQSKSAVKVIVLTNYSEPQYREIFLRQGAIAVLDKSYEFNRVEELLAGLIEPG
jgi:CheY-like chemotaxis protein